MREPRRTLAPDSIRRECEASLRRLGIERIDLYQFHWPDETGVPVEDSWHTMVQLVEEGKLKLEFTLPRQGLSLLRITW